MDRRWSVADEAEEQALADGVMSKVLSIIAETCGVPLTSMDPSLLLDSLGVDSLMTIEIRGRLRSDFPFVDFDDPANTHMCTAAQIAQVITSQWEKGGGGRQQAPTTTAMLRRASAPAPSLPCPVGQELTSVRSQVLGVVSEACGIAAANIDVEADLEHLGVDSLLRIEIQGALCTEFGTQSLDLVGLASARNVSDMVNAVRNQTSGFSTSTRGHSTPEEPSTECNFWGGASSRVPSSATSEAPSLGPATPLKRPSDAVRRILAMVLDVPTDSLDADTPLGASGLDSLTSIEALHTLRDELGCDVPSDVLHAETTLTELERNIEALAAPPSLAPLTPHDALVASLTGSGNPTLLHSSPGSIAAPLFVIHDGSGLVKYYERLASLGRDVWGIFSPHFNSTSAFDGVSSMAAHYVSLVSSCLAATKGPIILAGWSFGGVVAYEMSRQLAEAGVDNVKGLLLIDSPGPVNHVPLSDDLIDALVSSTSRPGSSALSSLVKRQFQTNSRLLGQYKPLDLSNGFKPLRTVLLASQDGVRLPAAAAKEGVEVPKWLAERRDATTATAGWEPLLGSPTKVLPIPGNHFEAFEPSNAPQLSARIREACAALDV